MPRTELTLEEKNVILNFYENTTAETSVRKMAMLFSEKFGKNVNYNVKSSIHYFSAIFYQNPGIGFF